VVAPGRRTVRLEIVPWLTQPFGHAGASRLVLEEDVEGPVRLGAYLAALARKYPAIGEAVLDLETGRLFEHASVVHNGTLLGSHTAHEAYVEAGDALVFLPAFSGG
jgi:molybdopterin converting factor small subunit